MSDEVCIRIKRYCEEAFFERRNVAKSSSRRWRSCRVTCPGDRSIIKCMYACTIKRYVHARRERPSVEDATDGVTLMTDSRFGGNRYNLTAIAGPGGWRRAERACLHLNERARAQRSRDESDWIKRLLLLLLLLYSNSHQQNRAVCVYRVVIEGAPQTTKRFRPVVNVHCDVCTY